MAKKVNVLEFYLPIKMVHITFVILSGSLFFLRGVLLLNKHSWAMYAPVRYLSYSIDTVLLTSALMLLTMLPSGMFSNGWLSLKILLLLVYIVLGSFALKRGRSHKSRVICFVAAVIVFCYMISVARMHHPLGIFFLLAN
jgi:uncharacterized membrane protein SirB2